METLWFAAPIGLTLVACVYDFATREIPHWIAPAILLSAIVATLLAAVPVAWSSLIAGVLLAAAIGGALYFAGAIEAGDVKLLAALGAWLGPAQVLACLFWMALAGTALAMVALARGQRDLAYVPAITAGLIFTIVFPDALPRALQQISALAS